MSPHEVQGQGDGTVDKVRKLAPMLAMGMVVANARFGSKGYRYFHLDTNSGSGWNDEVDVPGSPLVFHYIADGCLTKMRRVAFFCEKNQQAAAELVSRLTATGYLETSCIFCGDNRGILQIFAHRIRASERSEYAVGSVLIDPNGYCYRNREGEGVPPLDKITEFTSEFRRIDLLLNLNMRTYLLQRSQGHDVLAPADLFKRLGKEYWLVSQTVIGQARFLRAVGRNFRTDGYQALGFYHADSEMGERILNWGTSNGDLQSELFEPSNGTGGPDE